MIKTKEN